MARTLIDGSGGLVNHVELVYRPGERGLVGELFETLGCRVVDTGGPFLVIHADPETPDPRMPDNCLYASEVTAEQWRFEEVLAGALAGDTELRSAHAAFANMNRAKPQHTTHFGIRMSSLARLDEVLARVAAEAHSRLAGRVEIAGVFRPGDKGSLSPILVQAFVKTDLCAAGFVSLGQHIELQALSGR
jgi:hypothetical protein